MALDAGGVGASALENPGDIIWPANLTGIPVQPSHALSVLVLDDGPAASTLAESGFPVREVRSAEEAIDLIRERPFDLILLDMNVPGWNSLGGCAQIRKFTPGSKIIMLAAVDADKGRVRSPRSGRAGDCVNKPLQLRELVARAQGCSDIAPQPDKRDTIERRAS